MLVISLGSTSIEIRNPQFGMSRATDSGVILKSNLSGGLLTATTAKTSDVRVLKFEVRQDKALSLRALLESNPGKLFTVIMLNEVVTCLIRLDEFELSTTVDGWRSFSLRVRVISRATYDSFGIKDDDEVYILDDESSYMQGET